MVTFLLLPEELLSSFNEVWHLHGVIITDHPFSEGKVACNRYPKLLLQNGWLKAMLFSHKVGSLPVPNEIVAPIRLVFSRQLPIFSRPGLFKHPFARCFSDSSRNFWRNMNANLLKCCRIFNGVDG